MYGCDNSSLLLYVFATMIYFEAEYLYFEADVS